MSKRAIYKTEWVNDGVLCIRDIGHDMGHKSVTNDVENVVTTLLNTGELKLGMKLLYYDSQGDLDQIEFDDSGFLGFVPGPR
jgi:hypothetical protein